MMKNTFGSPTIEKVLGMEARIYERGPGVHAQRTPLHVEFGTGPDFAPATPLEHLGDAETFNAVGSRGIALSPYPKQKEVHLPVIDVDGGAAVHQRKFGSKAILYATRAGTYRPTSRLRDVLGDNGIDLEVFEAVSASFGNFLARTYVDGKVVTALALRSKESDLFEVAASTQQNHNHLYIQRAFSSEDHDDLIHELAETGIITEEWRQLTEESGMGIVRTPWTEKAITHWPS